MDEPAFEIPTRPTRRFSRETVEYEGETVFHVVPHRPVPDGELRDLVDTVLESAPYHVGDWFDLPVPLYLVHDRQTGDTFRVAVRHGRIELHVLPATESAGLRSFYDRLREAGAYQWTVDCRTTQE